MMKNSTTTPTKIKSLIVIASPAGPGTATLFINEIMIENLSCVFAG